MEVKEGKWEKGLTGKSQGPSISPAKTISIFSLIISTKFSHSICALCLPYSKMY